MSLFTSPVVRATDANNLALSGAKWFFYTSGTTVPALAYADAILLTPLSNPVVADSGGLFPLHLPRSGNQLPGDPQERRWLGNFRHRPV
jgi:hypothetical protein